ncbi:RraA family protein [Ferruginivarius sediminum]|nr:RraA family protein [Ferruginivarius sediminum]
MSFRGPGNQQQVVESLHAGTIADVLDAHGVWGCLDPRITCASAGRGPIFGEAYTIAWAPVRKTADIKEAGPSTWTEVRDFLAPDVAEGSGKVYVAGAGPILETMALAGGLSCEALEGRGFEGMVLGGAIRDAHVIKRSGMPVFVSNFTPADTQGGYRVSETGGACTIGSVTVQTGDLIFGDETGVVVVPQAIAPTVIAQALEIEQVETGIVEQIRAGKPLHELVDEETGRI